MRFAISIFITSILLHGVANAQNDKVLRGPAPSWVVPSPLMAVPEDAGGLVFVRRQDVLIRLDEKGQLHHNNSRIKILHPNALQIGNLSLSWNPASGAPTVHTMKVYRDGEVNNTLPEVRFEILRREGQLEAAMLDGILTAVVQIPDLRVGDELEFAYTVPFSDLTLGDNDAGLLFLQANPPLGRFRFGLNWIEGQKPNIKMTNDIKNVAQKGKQAVEFRFDNPPHLTPAKDAPPRYNWQRIVEYSDFSDWGAISQQFATLFNTASRLPDASPLKQEAKRIANAHESPFDRANAALKLVQQNVRYIYVGLNKGNLTPASAEETWQRRYGDCKGKTALLLGILNELGIKAEPVLANNAGGDDGLDERLPNPGLFDHVLVRALIDGKIYYLDGTLPPVVPPSSETVFPYRWILPLRAKGATIEALAWKPAKQPDELNLFEIDARSGFDKPARKISTTITRGVKGLGQQVQLSGLAPNQLLSAMRQQMIGDTWQTVDDVKWRFDQNAQASVLMISGTGTVDWDDDGDGAKSMALPGGGFSPPNKRIRAKDQDQDLPYYTSSNFSCYVTTVRFPTDTQAMQWSFKRGYNTRLFGRNYYRAFDLREGSIRMIRGSRVEKQEFDAVSANRDNDRIGTFDNSMAWIYFDPNGQNTATGSDKIVPATYDIDWVTDSKACLSTTNGN
ncbi:MAG: DUF3857 domain-containing transglutaminase family protein [Parasphingorhabdus sp.]